MKAAQGKALTPTSFVCDKKRRRYQSLLSVSLTVIAFNSPLILLSVLMSGAGKSQMLTLDQMHPVATLISWQWGSSLDDKLWVLQIMSSWILGVCVGKLLTCLESGIPVPAKGQPRAYSNASHAGKVPGTCILMDSSTTKPPNRFRVISTWHWTVPTLSKSIQLLWLSDSTEEL